MVEYRKGLERRDFNHQLRRAAELRDALDARINPDSDSKQGILRRIRELKGRSEVRDEDPLISHRLNRISSELNEVLRNDTYNKLSTNSHKELVEEFRIRVDGESNVDYLARIEKVLEHEKLRLGILFRFEANAKEFSDIIDSLQREPGMSSEVYEGILYTVQDFITKGLDTKPTYKRFAEAVWRVLNTEMYRFRKTREEKIAYAKKLLDKEILILRGKTIDDNSEPISKSFKQAIDTLTSLDAIDELKDYSIKYIESSDLPGYGLDYIFSKLGSKVKMYFDFVLDVNLKYYNKLGHYNPTRGQFRKYLFHECFNNKENYLRLIDTCPGIVSLDEHRTLVDYYRLSSDVVSKIPGFKERYYKSFLD